MADESLQNVGQLKHLSEDDELIRGQHGEDHGRHRGKALNLLIHCFGHRRIRILQGLIELPDPEGGRIPLQQPPELRRIFLAADALETLHDLVGGHPGLETAPTAAAAAKTVGLHTDMTDFRAFEVPVLVDPPIRHNGRADTRTPLDEHKILQCLAGAVEQLRQSEGLDVVLHRHGAVQIGLQNFLHRHRLVPDSVSAAGHTVGAPDNAGQSNTGPQKLTALDALLPEQRLSCVGDQLQEGLRLGFSVGLQRSGDALLPPQIGNADGTCIGFDGNAQDITIIVVDVQKDLPPAGPLLLCRHQLSLFIKDALCQQLTAEGAHCRRGQSQLLGNVLSGGGAMVIEQPQNLTAIPALYTQKIDACVSHFLLPPMSTYE